MRMPYGPWISAWLQRLERLRAVRGRAVHDTVVVPAARRLIVAGIRE
jgi:hypothetical protein